MRRKETPTKAPEFSVLAIHYLRVGLSQHPNIKEHLDDVEALENMQMYALMKLAEKLGVDPDSTIEAAERDEHERRNYSLTYPAFRGSLEFDLTIGFLGNSVTRKAKIVYEHSPEWEYFDLRKNSPYSGTGSTSYHMEIEAVPEHSTPEESTEGTPYWVRSEDLIRDDVLPHEMWDVALDAVDEKCKAEDAARRKLAAAEKATAYRPKSRKRH